MKTSIQKFLHFGFSYICFDLLPFLLTSAERYDPHYLETELQVRPTRHSPKSYSLIDIKN